MAKPDLGDKRQCQNCGTKFFDLHKSPILCPKCGTVFEVAAASRSVSRTADKEEDEVEPDQEAEVVSLEDADQVEDGKVTAASTDDDTEQDEDDTGGDDDDTFLEEDDEDDGDVTGLVDNEMDEDEER